MTAGVPASFDDVKTLAQSVRLPRDVIQNNNGLCIELADHVGIGTGAPRTIDAALVMVPGHCYVIAYSPSTGLPLDQGIPIECTSITPQAVDKTQPVSFDDSVKMAVEETKRHEEDGRILILPVAEYEQMGFTPPELPDMDVAKVTETLEKRLAPNRPPANLQMTEQNNAPQTAQDDAGNNEAPAQPPPPEQTLPPQQPGRGTINWRHPNGYVSIDFPSNFVSVKPAVNPGNVLLLVAGNPATSLVCDVMQVVNTEDPGIAWAYISKSCAKHNIRLKLEASKVGNNGMVFYSGTTNNHGALTQWVAAGKPVPNGVIFVSAGTNQLAWKTQYNNVMSLLNNVHFK